MEIKNNKDYRFWYQYKHMVETVALPLINEALYKEVKAKCRAYSHRPLTETRLMDVSIDGMTELFPLPCGLESESEAREYFEEYEVIHYRPTYYDCTGQLFTSWYKVFKRGERFWAYHRICRDI